MIIKNTEIYICEFCGTIRHTKEEAEKCEEAGKNLKKYETYPNYCCLKIKSRTTGKEEIVNVKNFSRYSSVDYASCIHKTWDAFDLYHNSYYPLSTSYDVLECLSLREGYLRYNILPRVAVYEFNKIPAHIQKEIIECYRDEYAKIKEKCTNTPVEELINDKIIYETKGFPDNMKEILDIKKIDLN